MVVSEGAAHPNGAVKKYVLEWESLAVGGGQEYPWPKLGTELAWEELRGIAWRVRGGTQREASSTPLPTPMMDS